MNDGVGSSHLCFPLTLRLALTTTTTVFVLLLEYYDTRVFSAWSMCVSKECRVDVRVKVELAAEKRLAFGASDHMTHNFIAPARA